MTLPWVFQKKPNQISDNLYAYKLISGIKENSIALGYLLNVADYYLPGAKFPNYWKSIDERNYVDYHSTLEWSSFIITSFPLDVIHTDS